MTSDDFDPEDPTLEDALDGLIAAANYFEEVDEPYLSAAAGALYQRAAEVAPDEHWNDEDPEIE